jgi:hypothetical protein
MYLIKKKIEGVVITVGNVTISDISNYTRLPEKEVEKYVKELIKENKIKWS